MSEIFTARKPEEYNKWTGMVECGCGKFPYVFGNLADEVKIEKCPHCGKEPKLTELLKVQNAQISYSV